MLFPRLMCRQIKDGLEIVLKIKCHLQSVLFLNLPFETEQNLLSMRRKARKKNQKVVGKIIRGLEQQKFPYKLPNIEQALRPSKPREETTRIVALQKPLRKRKSTPIYRFSS